MKKTILALAVATALVVGPAPTAQAHGNNNIAGAVIGGILAGAVIADVLQPHATYYTTASYCPPPAPVYCPPRVVYYPQPVCAVPAPRVYVSYGSSYGPAYGYGYGREHGRGDWGHKDYDRHGYGRGR